MNSAEKGLYFFSSQGVTHVLRLAITTKNASLHMPTHAVLPLRICGRYRAVDVVSRRLLVPDAKHMFWTKICSQ